MTPDDLPTTEQQLQAYQDGLLNEVDREAFEATLPNRPEVAAMVKLQSEVDDSLQRLFQPPPVKQIEFDAPLAHVNGVSRLRTPRRVRWIALLVTSALVAWALVAWQLEFFRSSQDEPYFQARPLVEIYQETVARGFKPYYECRDEERFAFTFELRQGQRLRLADLPEGRQMLGLSYSGGLSRDTTAMLCIVDELPVIVFVDRLEADQPQSHVPAHQLNVFRREFAGLVLYEVTPYSEPRMLENLVMPPDRP